MDKVQLEDAHKAGVFANASPDSIAFVPYSSLRSDDRFVLCDMPEGTNNYETKTSKHNFF